MNNFVLNLLAIGIVYLLFRIYNHFTKTKNEFNCMFDSELSSDFILTRDKIREMESIKDSYQLIIEFRSRWNSRISYDKLWDYQKRLISFIK
jgi:hypothetical protein